MDSKHNRQFSIVLTLAATLLSAAAFYFGTGLRPQWWLMWLAALPLLWIAPKLSWLRAGSVAAVARILGGLSYWSYYRLLHLPLWFSLEALLFPAILFGLGVLLFRAFFRRGQLWLAVLVLPVLAVTCEYLTDFAFGTFQNTAYTQLNTLVVLQLAAVTGLWGISFVVMLFAPMLAVVILSRGRRGRSIALALAGVMACVLSYGAARLWITPAGSHTLTVGLVSTQLPQNTFLSWDGQKELDLARAYAAEARALAARGAKIIVLPEMSIGVSGSLSHQVDDLFEQTARGADAEILVGLVNNTPAGRFNEARLYSETGAIGAVYRKHHLVPVVEGGTTPANGISVLYQPVGTVGLAICRDMDYFDPSRGYASKKVGLLLIPAWDFDVDRWWHGHMALMRAVENGFSIVRTAKQGLLTVSDDRGRVLAEASTTSNTPFTTLLATVPVRHDRTLYQTLGDWFAWLNLALLCGLIVLWIRARPGSSSLAKSVYNETAGSDYLSPDELSQVSR